MRVAIIASLLAILVGVVVLPTVASASSTSVVISEFRTRGPNGGNDEFIELYNRSSSVIDISGWKVNGSNDAGTTGTRATIPAGTTLGWGCHYLLTNSATSGGPYSGAVLGDQTYSTGITDTGGIALLDAANVILDQVGMSAGSAYKEGTVLPAMTTNTNQGYERLPGGYGGSATDTDNNFGDFKVTTPSDPQNHATCFPTPVDTGTWGALKVLYR